MIDARVQSICEEVGIRIVDGRSYPGIRETRAIVTMNHILTTKGEDHFRMVMTTVGETENNQGYIDRYLLWAVSDLVETYSHIVEHQTSEWLECFDKAPVAEFQVVARGHKHQRYSLVGMIGWRIAKQFGPNAAQGDLFEEGREAA